MYGVADQTEQRWRYNYSPDYYYYAPAIMRLLSLNAAFNLTLNRNRVVSSCRYIRIIPTILNFRITLKCLSCLFVSPNIITIVKT